MKRIAKRALVFLALGCLTTLIIAWGIALRVDVNGAPRHNRNSGLGMTGVWNPAQQTVWTFNLQPSVGYAQMSLSNRGQEPPGGFETVPAQTMIDLAQAPAWSTIRRGDAQGFFGVFYIEQAFGWPFHAMAQRHRFPRDPSQSNSADGLALPTSVMRFATGRHLPLRVIWPGFLGDAVVFAWMWYAVTAFPMVLVRSRRRKRGACPSCGYDVRYTPDSPCPECGAAASIR